ncbi:hypothetical protein [Nitrosococcus halophilus]|nr:hypothetical protein [Nitrosococcus halophilus]
MAYPPKRLYEKPHGGSITIYTVLLSITSGLIPLSLRAMMAGAQIAGNIG